MDKKIIFKARDKYGFDTQPQPYPAAQNLPDWWKEAAPYMKSPKNPDGKKLIVSQRTSNAGFKKCVPMLDAMLSGYIIPLWADVQVSYDEKGTPLLNSRTNAQVFQLHGESAREVEPPTGYSNFVYKYVNTWIPITPPGYSVLVTSPFGHRNLPFQAVPAIVDSDRSTLEIIPPMWLKEGFEGVIEKGTPLVQITPFKRTSWKAEFEYYEGHDYQAVQEKNFNANIINHYVRNAWSKKDYR